MESGLISARYSRSCELGKSRKQPRYPGLLLLSEWKIVDLHAILAMFETVCHSNQQKALFKSIWLLQTIQNKAKTYRLTSDNPTSWTRGLVTNTSFERMWSEELKRIDLCWPGTDTTRSSPGLNQLCLEKIFSSVYMWWTFEMTRMFIICLRVKTHRSMKICGAKSTGKFGRVINKSQTINIIWKCVRTREWFPDMSRDRTNHAWLTRTPWTNRDLSWIVSRVTFTREYDQWHV